VRCQRTAYQKVISQSKRHVRHAPVVQPLNVSSIGALNSPASNVKALPHQARGTGRNSLTSSSGSWRRRGNVLPSSRSLSANRGLCGGWPRRSARMGRRLVGAFRPQGVYGSGGRRPRPHQGGQGGVFDTPPPRTHLGVSGPLAYARYLLISASGHIWACMVFYHGLCMVFYHALLKKGLKEENQRGKIASLGVWERENTPGVCRVIHPWRT